ncbi:MAG TPA: class I SAM-dependent methyltransferase [Pseudolabrys sp.]|nr:class I SAM-dependent methyltransferase [Pseudolabrys sp.]
MKRKLSFAEINENKVDFSTLYSERDPRSYFKYLGELDYIIPHLAQPIFAQLIAARSEVQDEPVTVLDLGSSYAVNGALMKFGLTYETLRDRYTAPALQSLSSDALLELDRAFFKAWPRKSNLRVIALDVSQNAIRYAQECGAVDLGLTLDLEARDPTAEEAQILSGVDLIVSTGCVGYVTSKTFQRLLRVTRHGRTPWVASFVLRMFPYDQIAATLSGQGLVTEQFEGATFVQRRFGSREEMEATVEAVERRGLDTHGREAAGLYHAELFISRSPGEIERKPIQKLVSVVSGANKPWSVGMRVMGSFGEAARRRVRADRPHLALARATNAHSASA